MLNLSGNFIRDIPADILQDLKELETLALDRNELGTGYSTIRIMRKSQLQSLSMRGQCIIFLSDYMTGELFNTPVRMMQVYTVIYLFFFIFLMWVYSLSAVK